MQTNRVSSVGSEGHIHGLRLVNCHPFVISVFFSCYRHGGNYD